MNSGQALAGVLGTPEGRIYTVIGDMVNLAERIQGTAPVGRVAIGAATLRGLRGVDGVRVEPLGPVAVKGKREPIDVFVLDAL